MPSVRAVTSFAILKLLTQGDRVREARQHSHADRGVKAGLGEDPGAIDALEAAWATEGAVTLPIYYQWRFRTGTVGSFEDLVVALQAKKDLPATVGLHKIDVSEPGLARSAGATPLSSKENFVAFARRYNGLGKEALYCEGDRDPRCEGPLRAPHRRAEPAALCGWPGQACRPAPCPRIQLADGRPRPPARRPPSRPGPARTATA